MTAIQGVTILFRANSHVILTLPYIWGMAGRESCAGASCGSWVRGGGCAWPGAAGGAGVRAWVWVCRACQAGQGGTGPL
jgi:hypothetical protein